jgi:Right handed beta helix region
MVSHTLSIIFFMLILFMGLLPRNNNQKGKNAILIQVDELEKTVERESLNVKQGIYIINKDTLFDAKKKLIFDEGAIFLVSKGVKVIIEGEIYAGLFKIFSGCGEVYFNSNKSLLVYPQWWGASAESTQTDAQIYINKAIKSLLNGGTIFLSPGDYIIDEGVVINNSRIKLQGAGFSSHIQNKSKTKIPILVNIVSSDPGKTQIQDVSVDGVRIDGNRNNVADIDTGWVQQLLNIRVSNINIPCNISVKNCYFHDAYSWYIHNGISYYEGGGLSLDLTPQERCDGQQRYFQCVNIEGNHAWNNEGWGIGINWGKGVTLKNNHCWSNATMGITVWATENAYIQNNYLEKNGNNSLNIEASDSIFVSRNQILNSCEKSPLNTPLAWGGASGMVYNSSNINLDNNTIIFSGDYFENATLIIRSGKGYFSSMYRENISHHISIRNNIIQKNGSDGFCVKIDTANKNIINKYQEYIKIEKNIIENTGRPEKLMQLFSNNLSVRNNVFIGSNSFSTFGTGFILEGNIK